MKLLKEGPQAMWGDLGKWTHKDGITWHNGYICVPKDDLICRTIIKTHHNALTVGHPRRAKTLELVQWYYWWSSMTKFIHNYVDGCAIYQSTKNLTHRTWPPIQLLETANTPWCFISTDFITDLPKSKGYDLINVVVDQGLSKGIIITPCNKTITAEETMTLFQNNVFNWHGLLTKIVLDHGPQFVAKFTCELWKQLGISPMLSTAYHPQTDGDTYKYVHV